MADPKGPLVTTAPTVVLLTKPNHLGAFLEQRLAETGLLKAVFLETRQRSVRHRWQYGRRLVRAEGWLRAADVIGYDLLSSIFRAKEFQTACDAFLPLSKHPAPNSPPRFSFANLNLPQARTQLASLRADVFVVHATGILAPATFSLAQALALNVHCGVLPEYRGHASTFWALRKGDYGNVGVSIHEIAAKVDTGRLLRVGRVRIGPADTDITAWLKAFSLGVELTIEVLNELVSAGQVRGLIPDREPGPHYRRRGLTDHIAYLIARRRQPKREGEPG